MWLLKKIGTAGSVSKEMIQNALAEISNTAVQSFLDWGMYDGQGYSRRMVAEGMLNSSCNYLGFPIGKLETEGVIHRCSGGRVYAILKICEDTAVAVKLYSGDAGKQFPGWEQAGKLFFDSNNLEFDPLDVFFIENKKPYNPETSSFVSAYFKEETVC